MLAPYARRSRANASESFSEKADISADVGSPGVTSLGLRSIANGTSRENGKVDVGETERGAATGRTKKVECEAIRNTGASQEIDPNIRELARLLGRKAAREYFKEHGGEQK